MLIHVKDRCLLLKCYQNYCTRHAFLFFNHKFLTALETFKIDHCIKKERVKLNTPLVCYLPRRSLHIILLILCSPTCSPCVLVNVIKGFMSNVRTSSSAGKYWSSVRPSFLLLFQAAPVSWGPTCVHSVIYNRGDLSQKLFVLERRAGNALGFSCNVSS